MASEAYIVEAVRTAGGRRNGQLSTNLNKKSLFFLI